MRCSAHAPRFGLEISERRVMEDAEDAVAICRELAELSCLKLEIALDHAEHRFDAYNTASGEATTVADLVQIVEDLIPGARLSVGPGRYRHGNAVELVEKGALDLSRAREELAWTPKYDIRSGLAEYIRTLRENPDANNGRQQDSSEGK